jgi:hypothetical protein
VDAQQHRAGVKEVLDGLYIERVSSQPRGVGHRRIERVEVVVGGLDLGTLLDVEAETDEDVLDLPSRLRDQVQVPDRGQRVGGQGDVDAFALEPLLKLVRGQLAGAFVDLPCKRLPGLVGCLAGRRALLWRQLGHVPQQVRKLSLATEVADLELLELAHRTRAFDGLHGFFLELCDPI